MRRWGRIFTEAALIPLAVACSGADTPGTASPDPSPELSPTASASPSPSPSVRPSPSPEPTASATATPTAWPDGLRVVVSDSLGAPWAGAQVFPGEGGLGPVVTTDARGVAVLPAVEGPVTVSILHTYTARYSARDSYTVNRISTFPEVGADGTFSVTLFRDTDYTGDPRPVASPEGVVSGVDASAPATRVFVVGGGGEWTGEPSAPSLAWDLSAVEAPTYYYAAQVEGDGDGEWSALTLPLRFDLTLRPPRAGANLSLSRRFDAAIPLSLAGLDPHADALGGTLTWFLPGGAGELALTALPAGIPFGEDAAFPAPPADAAWAGDVLTLDLSFTGGDRRQTLSLGMVARGVSREAAFYPVPTVVTRLPLRSETLPGATLTVGAVEGADDTLFFFSERWYKPEPTSFYLWYDLWSVSSQGGAEEVDVPELPEGLNWPGQRSGGPWNLLERSAYVQANHADGASRRDVQTAASDAERLLAPPINGSFFPPQ